MLNSPQPLLRSILMGRAPYPVLTWNWGEEELVLLDISLAPKAMGSGASNKGANPGPCLLGWRNLGS